MKRLIKGLVCGILLGVVGLSLVACGRTEKPINNATYFEEVVSYKSFGKSKSTTINLTDLFSEDVGFTQLTQIELTGKTKWISYMTIKRVEYTIVSNKNCILDFNFNITNIKGVAEENSHFNSKDDVYSFLSDKTSLELIANKETKLVFYVNGTIQDSKAPTFILEIDNTSYNEEETVSEKLGIKVKNIEVFGEHK